MQLSLESIQEQKAQQLWATSATSGFFLTMEKLKCSFSFVKFGTGLLSNSIATELGAVYITHPDFVKFFIRHWGCTQSFRKLKANLLLKAIYSC